MFNFGSPYPICTIPHMQWIPYHQSLAWFVILGSLHSENDPHPYLSQFMISYDHIKDILSGILIYIWHFIRTCKCKFQLHLRSGWTFRVHSSQKLFVTIAVLQRMITWSHRPDCPAPLGTTHRPLCRKLWGLAPRVSLVNVFLLRSHEITLLSYWI